MNRVRKVAVATGTTAVLMAGLGLAASAAHSTVSAVHPAEHTVSPDVAPEKLVIPPELAVPSDQTLVATLAVVSGLQVYTCTGSAWTLLEPAAVLGDGDQLVMHSRGPEWHSTRTAVPSTQW